jgi:hypothetical protein
MRNEFWLCIALLFAVLSFVLPAPDFQYSLNYLGRTSTPLKSDSLKNNQNSACSDLRSELRSRQIGVNPTWFLLVLLVVMIGIGLYANHQKVLSDQFLFRLSIVFMVIVGAAQLFELSKQSQRITEAQALLSSYCPLVKK